MDRPLAGTNREEALDVQTAAVANRQCVREATVVDIVTGEWSFVVEPE